MLDFGREVCGHLPVAERREWLVTNGIGGFAMGTVSGLLTRRYHGLLVAALRPPLGRTMLVSKVDETAVLNDQPYPLFANRWLDGTREPDGFNYIERFHLEGTTPVWTFAFGQTRLEKRIWMEQGANTTYVQYYLRQASEPITLNLKAMVNYRDYHSTSIADDWQMALKPVENGLQVNAFPEAVPFYLLAEEAKFETRHEWYEDYFLNIEEYRGQNDVADDNLYVADITLTLQPYQQATLVATIEAEAALDGQAAYRRRRGYEQALLEQSGLAAEPEPIRQLVWAADQFIVRRAAPDDEDGRSVIAGYPWFSDWGRDTMIALSGLTLATNRTDDAAKILYTFSHFVDQGMLPNRFPDEGEEPEYNTVDATLWYFEALANYYEATGDKDLLAALYPRLQEIIEWHQRGTRYNIHLDSEDGLIYAGQEDVQLTWMDAKVDDWVVTPRIGKPVEINALWYNALCMMVDFGEVLGEETAVYQELARQTRAGFDRYWSAEAGYCYDVLDGPEGDDLALRPNQLLAISLTHSPLDAERQKMVVDICGQKLLTSHGLRSLAADDEAYIGQYGGDQRQRDAAYHQGTVWGWLIGPFVTAHLRIYDDVELAYNFLKPLFHHLADHGVGTVSEIFDGDPPFTPRGCPAQAWSVAELLRLWRLLRADHFLR